MSDEYEHDTLSVVIAREGERIADAYGSDHTPRLSPLVWIAHLLFMRGTVIRGTFIHQRASLPPPFRVVHPESCGKKMQRDKDTANELT